VAPTFFFGPIIGAVLMVLAFVLLSEFTKAWLLYLGLLFLFMVMYAPGGIGEPDHDEPAPGLARQAGAVWCPVYAGSVCHWRVLALLGGAALVEMVYHLQLSSASGSVVPFWARRWTWSGFRHWLMAALLLAAGVLAFRPLQQALCAAMGRRPGRDRSRNCHRKAVPMAAMKPSHTPVHPTRLS
jgi:branched-chain amino acid transport system permease protein